MIGSDNIENGIPAPQHSPQTSQPSTSQSTDENVLGAVHTVKLPPFWHEDPQSYFAMAELKFSLFRITSDASKFQHVASNFDAKLVSLCRDLILNPPQRDKYNSLKQRVLSALAPSEEANIRRLLHGHPLGSEKPTVYLQQLRNLAAGQCNETLLRTLFLEQMPEDIRRILVIGSASTLDQLSAQADKMLEISRSTINQVSVHSTVPSNLLTTEPLQAIINRLDKLEANIAQSRGRSQSVGRQNFRNRSPSTSKLCFYHRRFRERARKCQDPCSWKESPKPNQEN